MAIRSVRNGRRDTRSLVMLCLLAALAWWAPSPARGAGIPIEGMLLVQSWDQDWLYHAWFLEGTSDNAVAVPWVYDFTAISPDTSKIVYDVRTASGVGHAETGEIWVANIDTSGATNLTGPAGLGGVNCAPTWSPDGRTIAFQHAAPAPGQVTCEAGFQVWLMAADGTNLHQWIPAPAFTTMSPSWAPDGYRIVCEGPAQSCVTGDVTGANVTTVPDVNGRDAEWSRDGSRIAYTTMLPDTLAGESGVWLQLCLANPDGSSAQVLVQQFLRDSDLTAHIAKHNFQPADTDWAGQIRWWVGPRKPTWSPLGDRIAFEVALPFDPNGPEFWFQVEVWLYDLKTGQTTRVTNNQEWDERLSWAGPNTSSASPRVTVYGTSVTFSQVVEDGWTSIIRTEGLPPLPTPYLRVGNSHEIRTTAQVTGPATVAMSYADGDVATTAEGHLAMLRYDEAQAQWEDVTASRDVTRNEVRGESSSLGLMGLALPLPASHFSDVSSSAASPYWALWEIEAAYAAGIVQGYSDGTYQPTNPVTRDQMAVYISRALAGGDEHVPTNPAKVSFPDVAADHWAYKHIEYAVAKNVVKGYDDGTYKPDLVVDRGQMAVFVARAMVTPSGDAGIPDPVPPATFSDVPSGFWAYKQVEYCVGRGVVKGYDDGTYRPTEAVTRDQMAVYVARAFRLPL